jgi:hypothetical protein
VSLKRGGELTEMSEETIIQPKILPLCYKVAEHENVVWATTYYRGIL